MPLLAHSRGRCGDGTEPHEAPGVARAEVPRVWQSRPVGHGLRCRVRIGVLARRPAAGVDPRAASGGSPGVRERARAPACRVGEGLDGPRQRIRRAARLPAQEADGDPALAGSSRPGAVVAGPDDGVEVRLQSSPFGIRAQDRDGRRAQQVFAGGVCTPVLGRVPRVRSAIHNSRTSSAVVRSTSTIEAPRLFVPEVGHGLAREFEGLGALLPFAGAQRPFGGCRTARILGVLEARIPRGSTNPVVDRRLMR